MGVPFVIHQDHMELLLRDSGWGALSFRDGLATPQRAGTGLKGRNFQCHLQTTGEGRAAGVQSPNANELIHCAFT